MAYVLGKDLDKWDDSLTAREPYALTDESPIGAQYITGTDLLRSAKITSEWKQPVAMMAQAASKTAIPGQIASSFLYGASDSIAELPYNLENAVAQRAVELVTGKESEKSDLKKLWEGTDFGKAEKIAATLLSLGVIVPGLREEAKVIREKAKTYDEMVDLLKDREYPLAKYAQRVIADNTSAIENRRLVRELYNQAQGIDSSAWYNKAATIMGAMTPTIALSRLGYSAAKSAGATRLGAIKRATDIAQGYIGAEMAGEYAEETAAQYLQRTGDKTFSNFMAKDASGFSAIAYGAIGSQIEFLGGVEPIMAGALQKVGLRSGLLKAGLKIGAGEAAEEFLQGLTETLMRKMEGSTDKTWKDGIMEALNGAAWGLFIGGATGSPAFYVNRRNLVKGIKQALPNISDAQATQVADVMIDSVGEASSQDNSLRQNLRDKVATMYEKSDIENKEDRIDAITDLEYSLIAADASWEGIDIVEHPLFKGEVTPIGWFRAGISENVRPVVEGLITELNDLQTQLKTLNEAKEKDWEKIDEIERKLDAFDRYVLDKLGTNAPASMRDLENELRKVEGKYVSKEKERETKKAIKSGSVDVIADELSKAGFKTRDMSGTQIKELARLNWEILQGKDLGRAQSRGAIQKKLADIEANVESGNAVLERAGYTPEQIAKMDDETWNRAVLTQYRKEVPQITQPEYTESDFEGIEFQDEVFKVADENARLDDIYPAYDGETIEVDGKERTVYNSNGDRIAKSAEALRNFYKWFGDSKVVDYKDRPLVVYHGTNVEFDTFKLSSDGNFGSGIYMADSREMAKNYGDIIIPLYSKLLNPLDTSTLIKDMSIVDKVISDLEKSSLSDKNNRIDKIKENPTNPKTILQWGSDEIIRNNFDGIIYSDQTGLEIVAFEPTQIKSVDNRGTFSADTGNIYWQNRVSGAAPSTYRGAYIPQYRFIQRTNKMDATTLSHELAHDWFEVNFDKYRSGNAPADFMRAWGALEQALGVPEDAKVAPRKASEAFARAYEGWIMDKSDWTKAINVDDKDKDAIVKLMQDYQSNLRDVYQDLTNPYFKQTWGKLGELKPELVKWFDKVTNIRDLDILVDRGEMTEEQAAQEKLNRAIDTVIENTEDAETARTLKNVRTLNDTSRYEVEGGNKNALQRRIGALAQAIDENNMLIKENYDTRRDMLEVAKQADNFVRTRLDDALAIINGQMAEQEGLFKEDIYTALERLALEEGDLNLLDELKNSEIANRLAKELGQRVAGFRNWSGGDMDVVSSLKALDNKFNKALENKKAKAQMTEAEDLFAKAQEEQDKLADKQLDSFLKDLECK